MNVTPKIILGYCGVASLVIMVGLNGYISAKKMDAAFEELISNEVPTRNAIEYLRYEGVHYLADTFSMANMRGRQIDKEHIHAKNAEHVKKLEKALDQVINANHIHKEIHDHHSELIQVVDAIKQKSTALIDLKIETEWNDKIAELIKSLEDIEHEFIDLVNEMLDHEGKLFTQISAEQDEIAHQNLVNTLVISIGAFMLAILAGLLYARSITKPLLALKKVTSRFGQGELSVRATVTANDEVGILSRSFNEMADNLGRTTVSKTYVDNIISSMLNSLIVINKEGRIVRVNPATCRMLGYTEKELLGMSADQVVQDDFLPGFKLDNYSPSLVEGCAETIYRHKDRSLIPVLSSISALLTEQQQIEGLVMCAQDVSEEKKASEDLKHKAEDLNRINKELDQFAYIVSHDLKAPLRAIANLSQWIEEDLGEQISEDVRKQTDLLRGRVMRMESLINGILEYSRIGRTDVKMEMVKTADLLRDIIDGLPVPQGYSIKVAQDMPQVMASRVRLGQVFSNLLSNAIKYRGHDEGHVEISVRDIGDWYEFAVADDGPGIAPEYHEKIFIIFQTLAARDKVESTGIGLTLVKKIVEEQGGQITLESSLGKGAIFRFTWPKLSIQRSAA